MKRQILFLVIVLILAVGPGLEAGEIYQWIDKDGVQHFTNEPPPPGARIINNTAEIQSAEPPAQPEASPAGAGTADAGNPAAPVQTGLPPVDPPPDQNDADADEDDGVYDDVVVRDPRLRQREEIREEANRDALRQNYREEAQREDIRREADIEERRPRPVAPRRLR